MVKDLALDEQDISLYLKSSDIIDFESDEIKILAENLSEGVSSKVELAKTIYEYVRDKIAHSCDISGEIVTYKASDVLKHKQGICYAKSHLLAALLRYHGIPTGFCYQKLILDDIDKPWMGIHGLNGIYLDSVGRWIRVDARGNKEGVNAEFSLDQEKLAFPVREELGEADIPLIFASPHPQCIDVLKRSRNVSELINNLPRDLKI